MKGKKILLNSDSNASPKGNRFKYKGRSNLNVTDYRMHLQFRIFTPYQFTHKYTNPHRSYAPLNANAFRDHSCDTNQTKMFQNAILQNPYHTLVR